MQLVGTLVWAIALLYLLLLACRLVLDLVAALARGWRPQGIVAAVAEIIYVVTDPPIRLVRRLLPAVRFGNLALDLGFIVVMAGVSLVAMLGAYLAAL